MDGHNQSHNLDLNELTKEAEEGHGRYVRSVLDQIPFEEQIHIAHEVEKLNKEHTKLAGYSMPVIEFIMYGSGHDSASQNGYDAIRLYRTIPDKHLGPLFGELKMLYENSVNLTTGEKTVTDGEIGENGHNIDLNKLTKEAEAGHGRYVRSVLDQIPFGEQIQIANEMEKLSKKHNNDYSIPLVEFRLADKGFYSSSLDGYRAIRLYRTIPDKHDGPLFGKLELVYENSVNLTTGEETVTEGETYKK